MIDRNCIVCEAAYKPRKDSQRFCSRSCATKHRHASGVIDNSGEWSNERKQQYVETRKKNGTWSTGEQHHLWKGGESRDGAYMTSRRQGKKIRSHRLIAETVLGRSLSKDEVVHHIDGNGLNNRLTNLQVMPKSVHTALHRFALCRFGISKNIYAIGYPILGEL